MLKANIHKFKHDQISLFLMSSAIVNSPTNINEMTQSLCVAV